MRRQLEFGVQKEKPTVKAKNVEKGEGIFRLIVGIVLIISAFFISGVFRWILGPIGLVVILTAIFGY
jgi:ABC-type sugar transport system permease subunit